MPINRAKPAPNGSLDWVVVANASRARVLERDDENHALREITDHVHPASRMKGAELNADRPGHARKSDASTAFEPRMAPQEREHARFARELAHELETAALEHRMRGLVLLASNPFLGELKAHLGHAAKRQLKTTVAVDLTAFQGAELERRVTHALHNGALHNGARPHEA